MTVTPGQHGSGGIGDDGQGDGVTDPLSTWGRTVRLCTIKLTEAVPAVLTALALLAMRR